MARDIERALEYVAARSIQVPHGCRYWLRALTTDGYAKAVVTEDGRERTVRVHRWLMEQKHGPLPPRTITAHSCNESLCLHLGHLSNATQRTNMRQMSDQGRAAGRAHLGYADTRGSLRRAQAIQAALREGLDLEALAAAMLEGEARPLVRAALASGYDAEAYLAAVQASDPSAALVPLFSAEAAEAVSGAREDGQIPLF
ncbi:HNH endonuclease [Streptomyces scabiei]|uniref:HNH endonuclease n=1 Tax=Streptomyces scabiei TaxID=1930 RepID=UPI00298F5A53|nr:HNH endonuclease [Streptomyces scabiei]MDW8804345.1 HNH endonuclease [Streptomyces scabiei]